MKINPKKISIVALCLLLLTVTIVHCYFFTVDKRPAIDHDGIYFITVPPMYNYLEENGLNAKFLLIHHSSWVSSYSSSPQLASMITATIFFFFGKSFFIFKLINLIYFYILIIATYFIANDIIDHRAGILSSFVVATMPMIIDYSRKNHVFFSSASIAILAILFFIKSDNFSNRKYSFFWGITVGFMMLFHYVGLLYLVIFIVIYFLGSKIISRVKSINLTISILLSLFICGAWYKNSFFLYFKGGDYEVSNNFFNSIRGIWSIKCISEYFRELIFEFWHYQLLPTYFYIYLVSIPISIYLILKLPNWRKKSFVISLFFLILSAFLFAFRKLFILSYHDLYLFFPIFVIFISLGIVKIYDFSKSKIIKWLLLFLVVIILFNGFVILIYPCFKNGLSVEDNKLELMLFGNQVQGSFNNYIFIKKDETRMHKELMRYFKDEYNISKEGCLVYITNNTANRFNFNFNLNAFFEGISVEYVSEFDYHELGYVLFFENRYNVINIQDDKVILEFYEHKQDNCYLDDVDSSAECGMHLIDREELNNFKLIKTLDITKNENYFFFEISNNKEQYNKVYILKRVF